MKPLLFLVGICLTMTPGCAQQERISSLLRSMADGGPVPTEKAFYETVNEDYVNQLSQDRVREFLAPAGRLLQDPRPEARKYGLMCFLTVTLRRSLDSEPLLEPYVPELLRIGFDRADTYRGIALHVLGHSYPKLSPKTIAYLAAHLADQDNESGDTGWNGMHAAQRWNRHPDARRDCVCAEARQARGDTGGHRVRRQPTNQENYRCSLVNRLRT
jgi:hypothetical protein